MTMIVAIVAIEEAAMILCTRQGSYWFLVVLVVLRLLVRVSVFIIEVWLVLSRSLEYL